MLVSLDSGSAHLPHIIACVRHLLCDPFRLREA